MKIDIFILGALNEKSLNLKALLTLADHIKIAKWMNFDREHFIERIEILNNLCFIKNEENNKAPLEKANFSIAELGREYYQTKLKDYLYETEINLGMLVLFITFSNHLSRKELMIILEHRIFALKNTIINVDEQIKETYLSKFYNHNLKATALLVNSELQTLEDFLVYAKENEKWNDFLTS